MLSSMHGPNIASVYHIYCDGDQVFIVTERLDISFSQLGTQDYAMEEWEIATVVAEVRTLLPKEKV
jgi:hypothetical protein